MDADELWSEIDAQRLRIAALLDTLDDREWAQPSLCEGWTVRDVAAHLTLQQSGLRDALRMARRSPGPFLRGDLNGAIRESAKRQAGLPEAELMARIRAMVGSRRHNLGVTPYETLIDICVHSQDIAVPLGRTLPLTASAATAVVQRVWQRGWPWYPARNHRGLRFVATDADCAVGDGVEITGPVEAIALVLTGREVARERLSGWLGVP